MLYYTAYTNTYNILLFFSIYQTKTQHRRQRHVINNRDEHGAFNILLISSGRSIPRLPSSSSCNGESVAGDGGTSGTVPLISRDAEEEVSAVDDEVMLQ